MSRTDDNGVIIDVLFGIQNVLLSIESKILSLVAAEPGEAKDAAVDPVRDGLLLDLAAERERADKAEAIAKERTTVAQLMIEERDRFGAAKLKAEAEAEIAEAIYKQWCVHRGATNQGRSPSRAWAEVAAQVILSHGIAFDVEKAAKWLHDDCGYATEGTNWERASEVLKDRFRTTARAIFKAGVE